MKRLGGLTRPWRSLLLREILGHEALIGIAFPPAPTGPESLSALQVSFSLSTSPTNPTADRSVYSHQPVSFVELSNRAGPLDDAKLAKRNVLVGMPFGAMCETWKRYGRNLMPAAHKWRIWGPGCCDPTNCWKGRDVANKRALCSHRLYGDGTHVAIESGEFQWSATADGRPFNVTTKDSSVAYAMCVGGKWHVPSV
ncbi:unnamed protein product [Vitrella brassicaformis CCMP3155]|uniref:Uncharacterized protein n=1 Tax=Vitrella brassicaformis (strain CCMP3155) TaxID=1169540 RepID=A0A0G4FVW0_VITBC|nr:unnamed protein product [Vitrella brassicaformis CCMP3155]|eukprot:CEM19319.1 unnamed protein product [Vitrella brassicaformis CCMP3155]